MCHAYVFVNEMIKFFSLFTESEFCNRICCGPMREYVMHITDNTQRVNILSQLKLYEIYKNQHIHLIKFTVLTPALTL